MAQRQWLFKKGDNPPSHKNGCTCFRCSHIAWNKGNGVSKKCGECGKTFKVAPSREKTAFWCSRSCAGKHRKNLANYQRERWEEKIKAGYKPITTSSRMERIKFRREIQKSVFERDNYTCTLCGQHGGQLQVDHIQSWAEYVDLRFDINNCRTLCMSCHYKITFGRELPEDVTAWGHNFSRLGGE